MAVLLALALCMLLDGAVSPSFGQVGTGQQVDSLEGLPVNSVELTLCSRDDDAALPGAEFYLYRQAADYTNDPNGEDIRIGGPYYTNSAGQVRVDGLGNGSYYLLETRLADGYSLDGDSDGRYAFVVDGRSATVSISAFNQPTVASLVIGLTVANPDGSALSSEQLASEFSFVVSFGDGSSHAYRVDGGLRQQLSSGDCIKLRGGQQAVFEGLPFGLLYTVDIKPTPGYQVTGSGHTGNIEAGGCRAGFTAISDQRYGSLAIVAWADATDSAGTAAAQVGAALECEVAFMGLNTNLTTITVDGKPATISSRPQQNSLRVSLLPGQRLVLDGLPVGLAYSVTVVGNGSGGPVTPNSYSGQIGAGQGELPFYQAHGDSLAVTATVANPGSALSLGQEQQEFAIQVSFNGKLPSQPMTILLGEQFRELSLSSHDFTFSLKHGQSIHFIGLPEGLGYSVDEALPRGYGATFTHAEGSVLSTGSPTIGFVNVVQEASPPCSLTVHSQAEGLLPPGGEGREFTYSLAVAGSDPVTFKLAAGESRCFDGLPLGAAYSVAVVDAFADGYLQHDVSGGIGTLVASDSQTYFSLAYYRQATGQISGQVTWDLQGQPTDLPESVEVQLMVGEDVVRRVEVKPDAAGRWAYNLTVPLYDGAGDEIQYRISQAALPGFVSTAEGCSVVNMPSPPMQEVTGYVLWQTGDSQVILPEAVTVTLLQGGEALLSAEVKPNAKGVWCYSFTVPRLDASGRAYAYSVAISEVAGFTTQVTDGNITNWYLPPSPQEVMLPLNGDSWSLLAWFICLDLLACGSMAVLVWHRGRQMIVMRHSLRQFAGWRLHLDSEEQEFPEDVVDYGDWLGL